MRNIIVVFLMLNCSFLFAQKNFNHQDTLRGSIGFGRTRWDIIHYDITVQPDISKKYINGINKITFRDSGITSIQIDLQYPMQIDSILFKSKTLDFKREQNVYWVVVNSSADTEVNIKEITIFFQGKPRDAINPPWDGGWIWKKDANKNPFISVACQGLGASVWYPCKDTQSDEPDSGCTLTIVVPDSLMGIGNGRLKKTQKLIDNKTAYTWEVKNPINNYNIIPYIGKYSHFSNVFNGLKGKLDMDYWVLDYNLNKARYQFLDATKMMKAFEYWFGPYPFYEDGYKLVEAPHLGMEHQSAIAYGNKYLNGYSGLDLSGSGWGLKWDYIIVHESGHEWFANNITINDIADLWVHEGFTDYSETLFTEYYYGKEAANIYIKGLRSNIMNDRPIIGAYGVNAEGSEDMYYKGANLIHTIRQIINNDSLFRSILMGMNSAFYHKIVTSNDIEKYINTKSGINFNKLFDQYLRTASVPILEYYIQNNEIFYRFTNSINEFEMPLKINLNKSKKANWINVNNNWNSLKIAEENLPVKSITVDDNFYIKIQQVKN